MKPVEQYLYNQNEPYRSVMLYVRSLLFKYLPKIEEKLSYKIPFYYHNKKPLCYLNILKNTNHVDIAFVQGVFLEHKFTQLKNYKNRKQVRSLHVKNLRDLDEIMFVNLLKEASLLLDSTPRAWNP